MEKVKTGIQGFDELVEGGFPLGKSILLSGTPGTGKTIFALQYLYNGAIEYGERSLYISFEEKVDALRKQAMKFGWNLQKLEDAGKLKILHLSPKDLQETTTEDILKIVEDNNIKRLVIDSLSALAINVPTTHAKVAEITEISIQRFIYSFIDDLRKLKNTTILMISQTKEGELSNDGVSEFACDGVVLLNYESLGGEFSRSMRIRKMREVKNNEDLHPLEISEKGIVIHEFEQ